MNTENLKPDIEVNIDQTKIRMFRVSDPVPNYLLFELRNAESLEPICTKGGVGVTDDAGIKAALGLELGRQVIFEINKLKGGGEHAGDIQKVGTERAR